MQHTKRLFITYTVTNFPCKLSEYVKFSISFQFSFDSHLPQVYCRHRYNRNEIKMNRIANEKDMLLDSMSLYRNVLMFISIPEINECESNPCRNGGTCFDIIGNFTCNCTSGWTGQDCHIRKQLSSSSPAPVNRIMQTNCLFIIMQLFFNTQIAQLSVSSKMPLNFFTSVFKKILTLYKNIHASVFKLTDDVIT